MFKWSTTILLCFKTLSFKSVFRHLTHNYSIIYKIKSKTINRKSSQIIIKYTKYASTTFRPAPSLSIKFHNHYQSITPKQYS